MKPNLLLLHGALGAAIQLQPLAQELDSRFDVHLIDFPGHGRAAMPEAFSIPLFAAHVQQYCVLHNLQQVQIFGYSMGGYVALYLAKTQSQLVKSVATLATKLAWDVATAGKEIKMLQPGLMAEKIPRFVAELEQRHAPNPWQAVVLKTAQLMDGLGRAPLLSTEVFAGLLQPVLLLLGDRDKMVSLEETLAAYRALPQASLGILPGTPHPLEQANCAVLALLLQEFFGGKT